MRWGKWIRAIECTEFSKPDIKEEGDIGKKEDIAENRDIIRQEILNSPNRIEVLTG